MSATPEQRDEVTRFLGSHDFLLFQDEDLRDLARDLVQDCLRASENRIRNAQLHSIPAAVQSGGLTMLQDLAKSQADRNTKPENRLFWRLLFQFLSPQGTDEGKSLNSFVERRLGLPDPAAISDKQARNTQKKINKELREMVLEPALPVFCEHFTCHYHYLTQGGGT